MNTDIFTLIVGALGVILYFYQFLYIIVSILKREKVFIAAQEHHFAVLISARNEKLVIAELIRSIRAQRYPADLIDIYVVADNCTDNTAEIAREAGAIVYERSDNIRLGKGYALNYLLHKIEERCGSMTFYEAYFVFDADNVLEENFFREMNSVFDNGYSIVTSYRNSKNFGSNWITAGYALWFYREARFINHARMLLHTSCHVSGTGYMVSSRILEREGGWPFHLITEDMEFSVDQICKGEVIGYAPNAVIYDEQPTTFKISWYQRLRWSKGFYQVLFRYWKDLLYGFFKKGYFGCYDLFTFLTPSFVGIIGLLMIAVPTVMGFFQAPSQAAYLHNFLIHTVIGGLLSGYLLFYVQGLLVTILEWKKIHSSTKKKIWYTFTFPFFMATYIPIGYISWLTRAKWRPIPHTVVKSAEEIRKSND